MNIRWLRVIGGALSIELLLFALIPISLVNTTAFLIAVPIGCFVFAYLVTKWLLRPVSSGVVLHAALMGILATVIYFGLVFSQPDGWASVVSTYGAPLFYFSNAMRIAGAVAGGMHRARLNATGRVASASPSRV